ncbi:tyrosine-protein phosphatase [Calditerricola satsumensis]|uniref:Tyrosine-protein phosphatase n=1 Tax=Calditerricola satsumensis TaxID=373054 RepID=A0A8J3B5K7_9BACI|nr:CpsB/CapC family capsule biosynthesis tyrosine phosphatase [Calditerricola satsumensis]GGJ95831.1 tyrosine protein phosphatase [Calditerricola satsumensis]
MIDIHTHILPGVDDGAKDLATAVAMAREAEAEGIYAIVATPHHRNGVYVNEREDVERAVDELNKELRWEGINVRVLPGQEVHVYGEVVDDLRAGRLLTIGGGGKYVLLELPHDHVPRFADQLVYDLAVAGFVPVIPHPERNRQIREEPNHLYQLVKRGALAQLTAASVAGLFGKEVQKLCRQLVEHQLVHLIASDAHGPGKRGVHIAEAYEVLRAWTDDETAETFLQNAAAVVEGRDLYVPEPQKIVKRRLFGWFAKG